VPRPVTRPARRFRAWYRPYESPGDCKADYLALATLILPNVHTGTLVAGRADLTAARGGLPERGIVSTVSRNAANEAISGVVSALRVAR